MRVAIIQSSYIPWKGYFDIIHDVDLFIFYDDVQFTYRDWRTRNRVKTPHGLKWLTIPTGDQSDRLIHEVEIHDSRWQGKHWDTIQTNYARAVFFDQYARELRDVYLGRSWVKVSELNQHLIRLICGWLGITTPLVDSRSFQAEGRKTDRLISLLKAAGATEYLSGPSAKSYIDVQKFRQAGIKLLWKSYSGYPEYPQFFPPFVHEVTVLDLLFHTGPRAPWYIWDWRKEVGAHSFTEEL